MRAAKGSSAILVDLLAVEQEHHALDERVERHGAEGLHAGELARARRNQPHQRRVRGLCGLAAPARAAAALGFDFARRSATSLATRPLDVTSTSSPSTSASAAPHFPVTRPRPRPRHRRGPPARRAAPGGATTRRRRATRPSPGDGRRSGSSSTRASTMLARSRDDDAGESTRAARFRSHPPAPRRGPRPRARESPAASESSCAEAATSRSPSVSSARSASMRARSAKSGVRVASQRGARSPSAGGPDRKRRDRAPLAAPAPRPACSMATRAETRQRRPGRSRRLGDRLAAGLFGQRRHRERAVAREVERHRDPAQRRDRGGELATPAGACASPRPRRRAAPRSRGSADERSALASPTTIRARAPVPHGRRPSWSSSIARRDAAKSPPRDGGGSKVASASSANALWSSSLSVESSTQGSTSVSATRIVTGPSARRSLLAASSAAAPRSSSSCVAASPST